MYPDQQTTGEPLAHRAWAVSAASVVQDLHRAGVVWGSIRPDTFIVKSGETPFPVLLASDFSRAALSSGSKGEDHPCNVSLWIRIPSIRPQRSLTAKHYCCRRSMIENQNGWNSE